MTDEEEWKMRFYANVKLENGSMLPSRASIYVLTGINKEYKLTDENRQIITMLAGSSLFQDAYKTMAEKIEKGEMTEVECAKQLEKMGEEYGKELRTCQ